MGKFDVSLIRYLSSEDYRVLTAVSYISHLLNINRKSAFTTDPLFFLTHNFGHIPLRHDHFRKHFCLKFLLTERI